MKIKLDDVLEAMEFTMDDFENYFNIETGEIVLYADSMYTGFDNEELEEGMKENFDKYIQLPTKYDINEYSIMEEFIESLPEGKIQDKLERSICGRGAFRRFKDLVDDLDIEDTWFAYRDRVLKRKAIRCRWLAKNILRSMHVID